MRYAKALLALSIVLLTRPVLAEEDVGALLFGSWRLVSFQIKVVGEQGGPRDLFGPHPFGRLILTPEHYMAVFTSRTDRKPSTNEAEAAALLSSMTAYTGRFRVEGDKFITAVDGAWNEIFKANEQVRYFTVDIDKLTIRTAEQPSGVLPGKRTVSTLVWERER
jgi:Lipocalin-like domain